MAPHSVATFRILLRTVRTFVHRLHGLVPKVMFEALHVFVGDRVKTFCAELREEVYSDDHLLLRNPGWLLTVGARIAVQKRRRELFEGENLLLLSGRTVLEQMSLPVAPPSLSCRFRMR